MKKSRFILLAGVMLASAVMVTACKTGGNDGGSGVYGPDYSAYTDQFELYGYSAASDGKYTIDGTEYTVGESFLTTEQYQIYKNAGFNVFFPQSKYMIYGESGSMTGNSEEQERFYASRETDWEWISEELDKLESVGITKTIFYDQDISWLGLNGNTGNPLVGAGMKYATEEALDEQVYNLVKLYAEDERVHGIMLADEPKHAVLASYADLYHSIQRVNEKYGYHLYIHFNLNPLFANRLLYEDYYPAVEGTPPTFAAIGTSTADQFRYSFIRYKQYIEDFLDEMQPTSIQYDDYPLRKSGSTNYIKDTYIPCIQYVAGVARDRNIDFRIVTQTFDMDVNGNRDTQTLTEAGAKWLNNMIIGFGAKSISYFTYFTKADNRTTGEAFVDGGSFLTKYGQKTKIYDMMQKVLTNAQKFAPTVLQFKYQKSGVFQSEVRNFTDNYLAYVEDINEQTYTKVKSVSVNKESAMVNELYDAKNDRYMYMAMNIVDPLQKGSPAYQTITLEFSSEYKYAAVYKDGGVLYYKLKDNKLDIKGAPGDASFVIPFN